MKRLNDIGGSWRSSIKRYKINFSPCGFNGKNCALKNESNGMFKKNKKELVESRCVDISNNCQEWFTKDKKKMSNEFSCGELTLEEFNERTKQKEKEMKTNIGDDINQYLSQVDGKIIFGQVSDSVLKT